MITSYLKKKIRCISVLFFQVPLLSSRVITDKEVAELTDGTSFTPTLNQGRNWKDGAQIFGTVSCIQMALVGGICRSNRHHVKCSKDKNEAVCYFSKIQMGFIIFTKSKNYFNRRNTHIFCETRPCMFRRKFTFLEENLHSLW